MIARHTEIVEAIKTEYGVLVREAYHGHPKGVSNIYLLSDDGILWEAELPMYGDVYANPIIVEGDFFRCASWGGMTCSVSLETGKIVESILTK